MACAEAGVLRPALHMIWLAFTWPRAGCTACSMCEDTILGLETTARYRPENVPTRQAAVGLEASFAICHPI